MKKLIIASVALSVLLLASCGGKKKSSSVISEDDIKTAVEKLSDFQPGKYNVIVAVGYYELNNETARYKLRQLASNGVISYNAEQINEYDESNQLVAEHVFVNVSITDEGKKYVVKKSHIDSLNCDADMLNRFANEKYPMDSVSKKEVIPVRNPLYVEENNPEELQEDQNTFIDDVAQNTPTLYQAALAKSNPKDVVFIAMQKTVYKIENVVCDELMQKQGNAQADVIVENTEVTPFGRIVGDYVKGEKERVHFTFKYYIERGWDIENSAPVLDNDQMIDLPF